MREGRPTLCETEHRLEMADCELDACVLVTYLPDLSVDLNEFLLVDIVKARALSACVHYVLFEEGLRKLFDVWTILEVRLLWVVLFITLLEGRVVPHM